MNINDVFVGQYLIYKHGEAGSSLYENIRRVGEKTPPEKGFLIVNSMGDIVGSGWVGAYALCIAYRPATAAEIIRATALGYCSSDPEGDTSRV